MIFASDLDRTLVYSKVFLKPEIKNIEVVEVLDERNISHITKKSLDMLNLITNKTLFIPVTTRSREQYNRIKLLKNSAIPKYAVVANGGIILKDGEIDLTWNSIIKAKLENTIPVEEMASLCGFFLNSSEVARYAFCENLFIYSILNNPDDCDKTLIEELSNTASKYNYVVSKQGRKVYIIPACINKWSPLEYIMKKENIADIAAAGDSLLDYPMLKSANHSIVPLHGELYKSLQKNSTNYTNIAKLHCENHNLIFTENEGMLAGEEILENILNIIA